MAKFIIDTTVWIDFFRGALSLGLLKIVTEGIEQGLAVITDVIRNEILVRAQNQKDFASLRKLLSPLQCLRIADGELSVFDEFCWGLKKKGLIGKYTDVSIAFLAVRHDRAILSFDGYFEKLKKKGIIPS